MEEVARRKVSRGETLEFFSFFFFFARRFRKMSKKLEEANSSSLVNSFAGKLIWKFVVP